jgi:type IV pilus assembly protein PilO
MNRMQGIRERLFSPVGLHAVAFGILAIAVLVLGVRVVLDWRTTSASNADAIASTQTELKALELQTAPLRGLDKKVVLSRTQIAQFYDKRIPPSYSSILERLGDIEAKSHVHLTRVQYTQAPGSGDLTEIRMEAGLSGDYTPIMRFINGLERSQTFFVIRTMALSGQQSGTVNLRLQFSTWMRPADAAREMLAGTDEKTEQKAAQKTSPSGSEEEQ